MPNVKPGYKQISPQIPTELVERLEVLAEVNGRSLVKELTHAIERHLESPPTVRVVAPPLPEATVEVPAKKPRGRKK